jgi:hypothetical protein
LLAGDGTTRSNVQDQYYNNIAQSEHLMISLFEQAMMVEAGERDP